MAKISNTTSYPNQSPIEGADYLIGTAANSNPISKQTKTFTIQGIADFVIDAAFSGVSYRLPVFTAATAGQESFLLVDSLLYQDTASLGGKPGEVLGSTVYIDNGSGVGSLEVAQNVLVKANLTVNNNANILNDFYVAGDSVFDDSVTMNQEIRLIGDVYDSTNTIGNNEQVLVSDANGKVTWQNYQGSGLEFQGAWNALTNVPDLQTYPLTLDNTGKYWVVSVAGTTGLPGIGGGLITDWEPGDWAIVSEDVSGNVFWDKIDNSSVLTGQGTTGNVAIWTAPRELGDAPIKLGAGVQSLIFNNSNTASGDYSNAMGVGSITTGEGSFAVGINADASGIAGIAMGSGVQSTGDAAIALGNDSSATAKHSTAIGDSNDATGEGSMAFGQGNTSSSLSGFSVGKGNNVSGDYAAAIGAANNSFGEKSFTVGADNESSGRSSVAMGENNTITGIGGAAIGQDNNIIVDGGFALGKGNTINAGTGSGFAGYTFGINNTSNGKLGFAMGEGNLVNSANEPSFSLGSANQATKDFSFAAGKSNQATAELAIAMGYENLSTSTATVALGWGNETSAAHAVGLGRDNEAKAQHAVAIGNDNIVTANFGVALGEQNLVDKINGFAAGKMSKSQGQYAVAIGLSNTASGAESVALGHASVASGISATAIGFESSSTGDYATTIGYKGDGSGDYSFAAGYQAKAVDIGSVSIGYNNLADKQFTVAIGSDMQVNDIKGIGIGHSSNLNGEEVFGIGNSIITKSYRETVIGSFNAIAASQNATNWVNTDRLFTIGNGPSVGNESNALILTKAGNLALPTYGAGNVSGTAAYNLTVDANGNVIESAIGTSGVTGNGTTDFIPKWNSTSSLSNSVLFEGGLGIGLDTVTPSYAFDNHLYNGRYASFGVAFAEVVLANNVINIGDVDGNASALGLYDDTSARIVLVKGGAVRIGAGGAASEKLEVEGNIALSGSGGQDEVYTNSDALFLAAGGSTPSSTSILIQDANGTITTDSASVMGVGVSNPQAKLDVDGGIKMGDTSVTPSAANVGTMRYRVSGNNSYIDIIMQDGATSYTWVNIVQKNW